MNYTQRYDVKTGITWRGSNPLFSSVSKIEDMGNHRLKFTYSSMNSDSPSSGNSSGAPESGWRWSAAAPTRCLSASTRSGKPPQADVMFGGGVESLQSYSRCFSPYEAAGSPAIHPGFSSEDHTWTPFSALPVVIPALEALADAILA